MIGAVATGLMVLLAPPASPAGGWSLRIEPARCTLEKHLQGIDPALFIDTIPGTDSFGVFVSAASQPPAPLAPASLTFTPSRQTIRGLATVTSIPDGSPVIVMRGLPPSLLDALGQATAMRVVRKHGDVAIPISGGTEAVKALRMCIADQLVEWGADPAQFAPGGSPPRAVLDRDRWIPNSRLLKLAGLTKRAAVTDLFRMLVSEEGSVRDCRAVSEVTEPALAAGVCDAVSGRKLFSAAIDPSGKPVIGAAAFTIGLIRTPR